MTSVSDQIKTHLNDFTSVITRNLDQVISQNREEVAKNSADIARLEIVVENLAKTIEKQSEMQEKRAEANDRAIRETNKTLNEVVIGLSNHAAKSERLEFDRKESREQVEVVYSKIAEWQKECTKKYNDLEKRVAKIYIVATTISTVIGVMSGAAAFIMKVGAEASKIVN